MSLRFSLVIVTTPSPMDLKAIDLKMKKGLKMKSRLRGQRLRMFL